MLIARLYDQGQAENWNDSAQAWYTAVIRLKPDCTAAYFDYTLGLGIFSTTDTLLLNWLNRCDSVYQQMMETELNDHERAEITFQYAKMLGGIAGQAMVLGMFEAIPTVINSTSDMNEDSLGIAFWKKLFGEVSNQQIRDLYARAVELNPQQTPYLLAFCFDELFRVFMTIIDRADEFKDNEANADRILQKCFNENRQTIVSVRQQLDNVPETEKKRFPAVYYYLSVADYMLGNYELALDEINIFLILMPRIRCGYDMHCGIISALISRGSHQLDEYLEQLLYLNNQKCEQCPTDQDCFRLAYFLIIYGELPSAIQAIDLALAHAEKQELEIVVAKAMCLYVQDEKATANSLLQVLHAKEKDMDNSCLYHYSLFRSVVCARDGDWQKAISWANKALQADSTDATAASLLSWLKKGH